MWQRLLDCLSARQPRPGYHDNRMQGTRASVGCGSQRGNAMGEGGAPFLFLWEAWQGLLPLGAEWPLPVSALAFPSCHLCWELGGGAERLPWWEGLGSRWVEDQPSRSLNCAPLLVPRTLSELWTHHSHLLLGKNDKFRTPFSQRLGSRA